MFDVIFFFPVFTCAHFVSKLQALSDTVWALPDV